MQYDKSGTSIIYDNEDEYVRVQAKRSLRFKPLNPKRLKRHLPYLQFLYHYITKSSIILDAGCRNGLAIQGFLERGYDNIHGIDIVLRNVKECKKGGLRVSQGDCQDMYMYKKRIFHLIYCTHTLEHIPAPQKSIAEFHRVLRSTGLCFIVVPLQKPFPPLLYGHSFVYTSTKVLDKQMRKYFKKKYSAIRRTSRKQQEYWYLGKKK